MALLWELRPARVASTDAVHQRPQVSSASCTVRSMGFLLSLVRPGLGRLLVANRPTDGSDLLADDDVSISNLFTGDAPRSVMTMSRVEVKRGSRQTRLAVAWFIACPSGFARSLSRTGRRSSRSVRRPAGRCAATSSRAPIAAGRSRCCVRSPTPCSETSTPLLWPRRCGAARGLSTSTTSTTTRSRITWPVET
jgi:hypothetical protein